MCDALVNRFAHTRTYTLLFLLSWASSLWRLVLFFPRSAVIALHSHTLTHAHTHARTRSPELSMLLYAAIFFRFFDNLKFVYTRPIFTHDSPHFCRSFVAAGTAPVVQSVFRNCLRYSPSLSMLVVCWKTFRKKANRTLYEREVQPTNKKTHAHTHCTHSKWPVKLEIRKTKPRGSGSGVRYAL